MRVFMVVCLGLVLIVGSTMAQQQQASPCEEVRGILATNAADLATQVRERERENATLKAKLAEMEKKMANHKELPESKEGKKP